MSDWTNLSQRTNDRLTVSLDFSREENQVRVKVSGREDFILYPENENALDAFRHPFYYLNRALQAGTYKVPSQDGKPDTPDVSRIVNSARA